MVKKALTPTYYRLDWNAIFIVIRTECAHNILEKCFDFLCLENSSVINQLDDITVDVQISICKSAFRIKRERTRKNFYLKCEKDLFAHLMTIISTEFLIKCKETVLHAGAISKNNIHILFSGASHSGKSELALKALQYGWKVISDDLTLFRTKGFGISAFIKAIKPRVSETKVLEEFRYLETQMCEIGQAFDSRRLIISRMHNGITKYDETFSPSKLVIISRGLTTKLSSMSHLESLRFWMSQVYHEKHSPEGFIKFLNHYCSSHRSYMLSIADNDHIKALELLGDE